MKDWPQYRFVVHMKDGQQFECIGETVFDAIGNAGYGSGVFGDIHHAEEHPLNEAACIEQRGRKSSEAA